VEAWRLDWSWLSPCKLLDMDNQAGRIKVVVRVRPQLARELQHDNAVEVLSVSVVKKARITMRLPR
jgi:hypothetical protein